MTIQGPLVFGTSKIHHLPATTILFGEQRKSTHTPLPKAALWLLRSLSTRNLAVGREREALLQARAGKCSNKTLPEMPSECWVDPRALTGRTLLGSQGLNFPIQSRFASAHVSSCGRVSRRVFFAPPSSAPPHSWGISRVSMSVTSAFTSTGAP